MRHARSAGEAFAGGVTPDGTGRLSDMRFLIEGSIAGGKLLNDPRFRDQCWVDPSRNSDKSGVEMIALALATFKQCFKVASRKVNTDLTDQLKLHTSKTGIDQTSHRTQLRQG